MGFYYEIHCVYHLEISGIRMNKNCISATRSMGFYFEMNCVYHLEITGIRMNDKYFILSLEEATKQLEKLF